MPREARGGTPAATQATPQETTRKTTDSPFSGSACCLGKWQDAPPGCLIAYYGGTVAEQRAAHWIYEGHSKEIGGWGRGEQIFIACPRLHPPFSAGLPRSSALRVEFQDGIRGLGFELYRFSSGYVARGDVRGSHRACNAPMGAKEPRRWWLSAPMGAVLPSPVGRYYRLCWQGPEPGAANPRHRRAPAAWGGGCRVWAHARCSRVLAATSIHSHYSFSILKLQAMAQQVTNCCWAVESTHWLDLGLARRTSQRGL
jgi:hypothetical protein